MTHSTHAGRAFAIRGVWHRFCPCVPLGSFPLMYGEPVQRSSDEVSDA